MSLNVTIGIPIYNEEKNIDKLLKFLHNEKFDFELKEILLICSGCTDSSVNIVEKWRRKDRRIKLFLDKIRKGKFAAMNKILKFAKGDFIIFVNADTLPYKNSLNVLLEHFVNSSIGAVSGQPYPLQKSNTTIGYFQNLIWFLHHDISLSFQKITGELFAIRKGLVNKIPDKIINDDAYIATVIMKKHVILYEPKAQTLMIENINFRNYVKKRRRIAAGFYQLSNMNVNASVPLHLIIFSLVKQIRHEPKRIFHILASILVEVYCNVGAIYDIKRGRIDYRWDKTNGNS